MLKKLNYFWRLFGTGICFASFSLGGLLLATLVFPALYLVTRSPQQHHLYAQRLIQLSFRFFIGMMKTLRIFNFEIEGSDILRNDKGVMMVANHPSLIDFVVMTSLLPKSVCIVKEALWHNFYLKGVVRAAGYIRNSTDPEVVINECRSIMDAGNVLMIFPEGTRTTPGQPMQLQRGAANIAVRTGRKMRLVHIAVRPTTLTKSERWYQIPATKPTFILKVGDMLDPVQFLLDGVSTAAAVRHMTRELEQRLAVFPSKTNH